MHGGRLGRGEEGAAEEVRGGVWASSEGPALRRAGRATAGGQRHPWAPRAARGSSRGPVAFPFGDHSMRAGYQQWEGR